MTGAMCATEWLQRSILSRSNAGLLKRCGRQISHPSEVGTSCPDFNAEKRSGRNAAERSGRDATERSGQGRLPKCLWDPENRWQYPSWWARNENLSLEEPQGNRYIQDAGLVEHFFTVTVCSGIPCRVASLDESHMDRRRSCRDHSKNARAPGGSSPLEGMALR
jgi:hypothetical protein